MAGAKASASCVFSRFFFTADFSNPSDQCFRQKRLLRAQTGESLFEMMTSLNWMPIHNQKMGESLFGMMTSSNWMPMVGIVSCDGLCLPGGSVETSFWRVANWGIPFEMI